MYIHTYIHVHNITYVGIVQDCLHTLINIGKPIDKFSSIAG